MKKKNHKAIATSRSNLDQKKIVIIIKKLIQRTLNL